MKQLLSILTALGLTAIAVGSVVADQSDEIPVTTKSTAAMMDFRAGQAAADRGDGTQANALFRSAIAKDPGFAYAWYNLGNVAFSNEEFANAIRKAAEVGGNASEGERLLIEINLRFLDNDFAEQVALSKQLVDKYPKSPRAWLNLGNVQTGLSQHDEARAAYRKALTIDGDFVPAHTALANSYLFQEPKDFTKAGDYFTAAIERQPGEDAWYWGLGDVFRARGDLEIARDYYARSTQLDPSNGTAFVKKGHVNSFLGNYDEARADYDQGVAVAKAANSAFLANYKMFTWVHAGNPKMAASQLEELYSRVDGMGIPEEQRNGVKVFTLTNGATICMHDGMYDDAERMLEMRARLLRAAGENVGTDEFRNIQEANIAYFAGQLAARRGDLDAARKMAAKNRKLVADQKNPRRLENYHDLMGLIALKAKDYNKAVEHYGQANPNNMYSKYHLALAYEGAGRMTEARELFREVANWNFNSVGYALVRKDAIAKSS